MVLYFWWYPGGLDAFTQVPSLFATADYDGDGSSNLAEFTWAVARGASPVQYGAAASNAFAGPGVPVAGIIGLALLAAACIGGGAVALRRKHS
jgi:hypothetical protein